MELARSLAAPGLTLVGVLVALTSADDASTNVLIVAFLASATVLAVVELWRAPRASWPFVFNALTLVALTLCCAFFLFVAGVLTGRPARLG